MEQAGMGIMIHHLCGGSENSAEDFYGKKITKASIVDDRLNISFDDGETIHIWDDGQSCCEERHMDTDDDIGSLVGGVLNKIEVKYAEDREGDYGECHEQAFVEIATDKGFITIVNHNEHNGYYGGFELTITK